jgi:hypothetical protein
MRNHLFRAAALASAVLAAAACGDHGATGPGAPLTQADAAALSRAVFAVGAGLAGGGTPAGARGNRTLRADGASTFSFSFDTSQPCTPSGSVELTGALAGSVQVGGPAAVQVNVSVRHQGCVVQTDNGGTFKLNGDPGIDVAITAAAGAGGVTAFHATEKGAFTWEHGGSSGRCTVDVAADLVAGTQTVRLAGSFCGFTIDQTVPAS